MEEIKYKVVKSFTKYDYIVAHQKKYGWTSFKDSCAEFQKDMAEWENEAAEPDSLDQIEGYSDNFYKHGVMFGFLEKIEPEVFYYLQDKFTINDEGAWTLVRIDEDKVTLVHDGIMHVSLRSVKIDSTMSPIKINQKELDSLCCHCEITKI